MARNAVRSRPKVSYREESAEEDDDEDESFESGNTSRRQSSRPSRRNRVSLKEPSSDEDEGDSVSSSEASEDDLPMELLPVTRKRKAPPIAKRTRAAKERRTVPSRPRTTQPFGGRPAKRAKRKQPKHIAHIPTDGISPPWITLPEEVLINIFGFALRSMDVKGSSWLVGAARACHAFTRPALSVLYQSPDLSASIKVEQFINHMIKPPDRQLINYHHKVQHLNLNTRILGSSFDLIALIRQLPRLKSLDLWTDNDYTLRGLAQVANERYWQPPADLIQELAKMGVPLKSWRWNMRMMPLSSNLPLSDRWTVLKSTHLEKPLNNIHTLTLTNFDYANKDSDFFLDTTLETLNMTHSRKALEYLPELDPEIPPDEAVGAKDPLSDALNSLTKLSQLRFEYCNIVQGPWLLRLPKSLTSLEISGCSFLASWHLERYLQSGGHSLERLVLDHNPTLQLSFLAELESACPKLRELSMDLIYTNPNRADEIIQPFFDEILNKYHIPTWPASMQKLQILHLRQWDSDAAVVFFTSILDANLPNLRHLSVSASIDINWRDRTTFRDKWVGDFNRVFLRKPDPPNAHLVSAKAFREWKKTTQVSPQKSSRPRRAHDPPAASLRNMVLSALGNNSVNIPMCDVVDIRIDNSRPRENEFRESDFLDSEISGDSDFES